MAPMKQLRRIFAKACDLASNYALFMMGAYSDNLIYELEKIDHSTDTFEEKKCAANALVWNWIDRGQKFNDQAYNSDGESQAVMIACMCSPHVFADALNNGLCLAPNNSAKLQDPIEEKFFLDSCRGTNLFNIYTNYFYEKNISFTPLPENEKDDFFARHRVYTLGHYSFTS